MGRNGGHNPFRDTNGEFTTQQGAGRAGRSRAGAASQNWRGGISKKVTPPAPAKPAKPAKAPKTPKAPKAPKDPNAPKKPRAPRKPKAEQ